MILFFDTETTGTPKNYKASPRELDNWPRVIQLAWAFYKDNGELMSFACDLIKPDGWEIPKEKFWIDNGFSTEKSLEAGIPIGEALKKFVFAIDNTNLLVAHNMEFDLPICAAEMIRANVKAAHKPEKYCTMKTTTDLCMIPGPYGFKWPKLEELHQFLFGKKFEGAHDALNDVMACAACYFELKKRGLIKEPIPVL